MQVDALLGAAEAFAAHEVGHRWKDHQLFGEHGQPLFRVLINPPPT